MRHLVFALLLLLALPAFPATPNNDDSCDISVAPAATLLLPYFEVDLASDRTRALDTLLTITNASRETQIAHVTLWTDLSYPLYVFDLILTGYDVQAISFYDLLTTGVIAGGPPRGYFVGPYGSQSVSNPKNVMRARTECVLLPGSIPQSLLADIRKALTTGAFGDCDPGQAGMTHTHAIGYATIDVVAGCSSRFPTETRYYTDDLLYDNVLIGDWAIVSPNPITGNYASGSPLVHIRAIPEGSLAGVTVPTNLPRTFYERYTPPATPHMDRRQPLPSTFVARFIEGGTTAFATDFLIWRQGTVPAGAGCAQSIGNLQDIREFLRVDERENVFLNHGFCGFGCPPSFVKLSSTSRTKSDNTAIYPALTSGDVAGWMYLSLTNPSIPTQSWVVSMMSAEGRFSVAFDAAALGNGCSPPPLNGAIIGPLPNGTP
ncbi:MAG TPA: hypothetical protein VMU84_07180 [Thermoanaerobaculia bacterium]|nr:hypothetical protein [Thermoanaerobaculia bacterium]